MNNIATRPTMSGADERRLTGVTGTGATGVLVGRAGMPVPTADVALVVGVYAACAVCAGTAAPPCVVVPAGADVGVPASRTWAEPSDGTVMLLLDNPATLCGSTVSSSATRRASANSPTVAKRSLR